MRNKKLQTAGTAACIAIGFCSMLAFANWTTENSKPKHTAAQTASIIDAQELRAEESREAEKAQEIGQTTTAYMAEIKQTSTALYIETITTAQQTTQEATEAPTTTTAEEIPTETETAPTEPETQPQATAPATAYSADEIALLRIASCEAYTQGPEGMALVMRVIINRMTATGSDAWGVITAPRQFAAVNSELFKSGFIHPDAYAALEMIRSGWDGSQGAIYFCAPQANKWHRSALQYLFTYGGHEFYK